MTCYSSWSEEKVLAIPHLPGLSSVVRRYPGGLLRYLSRWFVALSVCELRTCFYLSHAYKLTRRRRHAIVAFDIDALMQMLGILRCKDDVVLHASYPNLAYDEKWGV